MKYKQNQIAGTFSDEVRGIINDIKADIKYYKRELENYYNGDDTAIDCETRVYYETELIPKLEADIEYYENYYLYE